MTKLNIKGRKNNNFSKLRGENFFEDNQIALSREEQFKKMSFSRTEKKRQSEILQCIESIEISSLYYNLSRLFIYRLQSGKKIKIKKYDFPESFLEFVKIFVNNVLYKKIVSWDHFIKDINYKIIEICSRFNIDKFEINCKKMVMTDDMVWIIYKMYNSFNLQVCPLSILQIKCLKNVLVSEKLLKLISFYELRKFLVNSQQVEFVREKIYKLLFI